MRVGVLQFCPAHGEKEKNFEKVKNLVGNQKLDLLILPELFATGYLFSSPEKLIGLAELFGSDKTSLFLFALARGISGCVYGGFAELDNGVLYNSAGFFTPEGSAHLYRKLHLFDREKLIYAPGNLGAVVVEYRGVRYGLAICFDWFFPEYFRTLALMGAEVICHAANLIMPYYQKAAPIRSLENSVFILTANRTGCERDGTLELTFTGESIITDPRGALLAKADKSSETLLVVDIDPPLARNKNLTPYNNIFNDRRNDAYRLI
jgi:predicted amidohydrolase